MNHADIKGSDYAKTMEKVLMSVIEARGIKVPAAIHWDLLRDLNERVLQIFRKGYNYGLAAQRKKAKGSERS